MSNHKITELNTDKHLIIIYIYIDSEIKGTVHLLSSPGNVIKIRATKK